MIVKRTGAFLTVYALEQLGVKYTFGIPGVHNTEIYDELNNSKKISPILVTHEAGASFMADATSRTSDSIGTCVIVPAAGLTHALSGIGEAFLDGIPMLIISGGTRRDSGRHYQLHQIDQGKILDGIIKKYYLIEKHTDIIPVIFEAHRIANEGTPGPVFVEIPVEIQMFREEIDIIPVNNILTDKPFPKTEEIEKAVDLLLSADHPGIYCGWGAVGATQLLVQLAELLSAPVSTTLQGLSSFPANHPLHTGVGFGPSSVPASQKAFRNCDVLLAVGLRFAELATGSYGINVPEKLIHIDINSEVFNKNYPASITLQGDASEVLKALLGSINGKNLPVKPESQELKTLIKKEKSSNFNEWLTKPQKKKVSPGHFFKSLRKKLPDDCFIVVDDGKHTFLTAELFPVYRSRGFISPTDFNCMGYCVPATIACKLNNPDKQVVGIVGDGAVQMTGMELITATTYRIGIVIFVFHDGELGQISQFQKIPLNRKTCTKLGILNIAGIAQATGAMFLEMNSDEEIDTIIEKALDFTRENKPVIVDVKIDYSKKTFMTKGVVKTNLSRFPAGEKARFIMRALGRHIGG